MRGVARVLWVTLALNWSVAALKILLGTFTNCLVIVADGWHSLSDGTSNIVGLAGITISRHPADFDHPYGHRKYETFTATLISFFLFFVAFSIAREAWAAWWSPRQPQVTALSFLLMGFTLAVNLFVVWYERRKARELRSDLLASDSLHTMTDVFVTSTVLIALAGIRWNLPWLDPVFSFLIAAVIAWTATMILKQTSDVLCDKAVLDPALLDPIVRSAPGVKDCHRIRTRGRPDDIHVDLHVLVDGRMTVTDSHEVANQIEHRILESFPGVSDVVVHVEPLSHGHGDLPHAH